MTINNEGIVNEQDQRLNDEGRTLWDQKAAFWDDLHGDDGNRFHRRLISPTVERLLALQRGEKVLDVACGNGVLARRLAALGGQVTAVDFSATLLDRARQRGQRAIIFTARCTSCWARRLRQG